MLKYRGTWRPIRKRNEISPTVKRRLRPIIGDRSELSDNRKHSQDTPDNKRNDAVFLNEPNSAELSNGIKILILLFVICLLLPISINVGPIRLSSYRILIILMLVPSVLAWFSKAPSRAKKIDGLVFLFGFWGFLALLITTPDLVAAIEPGGVFFIESFGAYIFARYLIRSRSSFRYFVRVIFFSLVFLFPFAVIESQSGDPILLKILSKVGSVPQAVNMDPRLGLQRSQVVFEHPILFGAYASSMFGLAVFSMSPNTSKLSNKLRGIFVFIASIFSVSTGAIAALIVQLVFIMWRWGVTLVPGIKKPWRLFSIAFILFYLLVDIVSTRTPFHVIVNYLTLSSGSAYNRIRVFDYGIQEVWRHPLFGIGLADWVRPAWMSPSMDNFWLYITVRYGLPAFFALSLAIVFFYKFLSEHNFEDQEISGFRTGLFISLGGLIVAGGTVHYWNAIFSYFIFLFGSGIWMIDYLDRRKN